jgi:hypothetical protein
MGLDVVRYVLVFLLLYSFRGFFVYFSLHVHVYIPASGPHMNISDIHNMVYIEPVIRVSSLPTIFSLHFVAIDRSILCFFITKLLPSTGSPYSSC